MTKVPDLNPWHLPADAQPEVTCILQSGIWEADRHVLYHSSYLKLIMEWLRSLAALGGLVPKKRSGCTVQPSTLETIIYDYGLPLLLLLIIIAFIMMIYFIYQLCTMFHSYRVRVDPGPAWTLFLCVFFLFFSFFVTAYWYHVFTSLIFLGWQCFTAASSAKDFFRHLSRCPFLPFLSFHVPTHFLVWLCPDLTL